MPLRRKAARQREFSMIYVIDRRHFGIFTNEILEMHRLRFRVFKQRLNWDVTTSGDLEIDEYDALAPVYLLHCDADGKVDGSVRLLPTTGPNMLRNTFPSLLGSEPAPQDRTVWEASRFAVDAPIGSRANPGGLSLATFELFAATLEFGISRELSDIVAVVDVRMERILRRAGWTLRRLSQAHSIGNALAVAGLLDVSPAVLARIRTLGGLYGPVLSEPLQLKETA
jgi:acyl homoserine lactone synthase